MDRTRKKLKFDAHQDSNPGPTKSLITTRLRVIKIQSRTVLYNP